MSYQHGTLDQVWETGLAAGSGRTAGRWSWRVSMGIIAALSVLGWSAAILGIASLAL